MKSIDFLTTEERVFCALPFAAWYNTNSSEQSDRMHWLDELQNEDYTDEQLGDIDNLCKTIACQTIVRLLQFLSEPKTDKQIIARLICAQKLMDNQHGNWLALQRGHDITVKTVRAERDRLKQQHGLKIK